MIQKTESPFNICDTGIIYALMIIGIYHQIKETDEYYKDPSFFSKNAFETINMEEIKPKKKWQKLKQILISTLNSIGLKNN